jgi:hypothetical protein
MLIIFRDWMERINPTYLKLDQIEALYNQTTTDLTGKGKGMRMKTHTVE